MARHASTFKPTPLAALLLTAAATALAQNPQVRPPSPGTATGITGDSAASMPLPGRFKDKPTKAAPTKRTPDPGAEPSDPHQVNGRATGGPDNKASQPDPSIGRGTGLAR